MSDRFGLKPPSFGTRPSTTLDEASPLLGQDRNTAARNSAQRRYGSNLPDRSSLLDARLTSSQELLEQSQPLSERRASSTEGSVKTALRKFGTRMGQFLGLVAGVGYGVVKLAINILISPYHLYHFMTKQQPPPAMNLNLPGQGVVQVNSAILPRLPKGTDIGQLTAELQAKVDRGHDLVARLLDGTNPPPTPASSRDVTDIMWYLQVKAETKTGQSFVDGSMTLPDPQWRIRQFLDSSAAAYQRDSSHAEAFQVLEHGQHRGIDGLGSAINTDSLYPHGMQTLLYGTLAANTQLRMPEDRIFLKLESHGAWFSTPTAGRDTSGPGRAMNRHDHDAFLGHSMGFAGTLYRKLTGNTSAEGTFKERLSSSLKNDYNALIKNAPPDMAATLKKNDPTGTAGGVRIMKANIEELRERDDLDANFRDSLRKFTMDHLQQNGWYDNHDLRIGREIIFTDADFTAENQFVEIPL